MKATVEEVPMFKEAEPYHRKTQKQPLLFLFENTLFDITLNNFYFAITSTNATEENIRFELDFIISFEIESQSVEKVVCTFVSPKLKQGEDVYKSEAYYNFINRAFYAPKGWSIKIKSTIYHSDGTEDPIEADCGKFDDIEKFPIVISGTAISIGLSFTTIWLPLIVETSYSNPYPLAEVLITHLNMEDFILNTTADYLHEIHFPLPTYEKLKIFRFHVPEEYRQSKLYLTLSYSNYDTQFLSDNVYILDDFHGIVDANGSEFVDVLVSINGYVDSIKMQLFYIRTQEEGLIISLDGNKMKMMPKIGNALMSPFFYGSTSVFLHVVDDTLADPIKYAKTT